MFFDLEATEGEWFPFIGSHIDLVTGDIQYDEPVPEVRARVRPMAPFLEERLAQRKKCVEHVMNPKTRQMERISYYPDIPPEQEKEERDDVWDYVITGLEGFKDKKTGKEIECTRENKLKLMKIPVFERFIARCFELLANTGIDESKALEKNSSTGGSSQTTKLPPD